MEHVSGNIFIRKMNNKTGFGPGYVIRGHTHNFDHTSIFFTGLWRVKKWKRRVTEDGKYMMDEKGEEIWILEHEFEREGPFSLLIEADAKHEFTFVHFRVPDWMENFISLMPENDAKVFRKMYESGNGQAWCVYSHRNPQGDVTVNETGWEEAYR